MKVDDSGVMTKRGSDEPITVTSVNSVQTASLSSNLPDDYLLELQYFRVTGPNGAKLVLQVHGTMRYKRAPSTYGTVVALLTHVGEITLDGSVIEFSDTVGAVFTRAGFTLTTNGRRLLGLYELVAFFNSLGPIAGLPENSANPRFPDQ